MSQTKAAFVSGDPDGELRHQDIQEVTQLDITDLAKHYTTDELKLKGVASEVDFEMVQLNMRRCSIRIAEAIKRVLEVLDPSLRVEIQKSRYDVVVTARSVSTRPYTRLWFFHREEEILAYEFSFTLNDHKEGISLTANVRESEFAIAQMILRGCQQAFDKLTKDHKQKNCKLTPPVARI